MRAGQWTSVFEECLRLLSGFPGGSEVKASACNAGDPGEGNGNPLQYSCLENPMDGGALRAGEEGDDRG